MLSFINESTIFRIDIREYFQANNIDVASILEDNLSGDFLYQMSNIEYPYVNND